MKQVILNLYGHFGKGREMKKANMVILLSLVLVFMLTHQARAEPWWPPTGGATIIPQNPTWMDVVAITLSGEWPDSCTPNVSGISVMGNNILFEVYCDYPPDIQCAQVVTPWEGTEFVGPLSPGTYVVHASLDGDLPVPVATFVVTGQEMDFGDCPEPYPTLLADDGARHGSADPNLFLGERVDLEPDGQPSLRANGDDANGPADDEDGVISITQIIPGEAAEVNITASAYGLLDAWMDFDIDGDWADPGEQIFTSFPLDPGMNELVFNVPKGATLAETYARFRFSSTGGLAPEALAADGEVEDYMVLVECYLGDDSDYPAWRAVGRPACWCCEYQSIGDVTGDGAVNIFDLLIFRNAYGRCGGHPDYDPCADLDHSMCVNIFDLSVFRLNYGSVFDPYYNCEWMIPY